jgi:YjbE family integral membrane protein
MMESFSAEFSAFLQVILIDLVLAGDNAVVVGLAAAGVAPDQRRKVIFLGIGLAVVMRIMFALVTTQLLAIVGLMLAGGVLLLWVCWKMYREITESHAAEAEAAELAESVMTEEITGEAAETATLTAPAAPEARKTFGQALWQITLADVSMSLDNVLAVAGAARDHTTALIFGLILSIALMGAAATVIARLINRYRWIAWIGLVVILVVALRMIYDGGHEVFTAVAAGH